MKLAPPPLPRLYPKQKEAIFCPKRYTFIEASTKVGKTAGCLIWLFVAAWNNGKPGRNYWWIAPIFLQAKMAYNRLKRMLKGSDPQKRIWNSNESELWIEIKNGARIWFKSADNPDGLYGEDVYGAVIDEATRCQETAWFAVRTTLSSTGGPVKVIGNVRGRKNWAYQLARRAEGGQHDNMGYFRLTAYDAVEGGIMSLDEVEDAKSILPSSAFNELFLAIPADDGGNPFGLDAIKACTMDGLSSKKAVAYGVDLAKARDWTVICGLDEDDAVCTLDRWQSDWAHTKRRLSAIIGQKPALVDSTGVGDPVLEDIQRVCKRAQGYLFTNNSKQKLMEGLATGFQKNQIRVPRGWLTNELESFEYEYVGEARRRRVRYSAPEGMNDDGVYALALARRRKETFKRYRMAGGRTYAGGTANKVAAKAA